LRLPLSLGVLSPAAKPAAPQAKKADTSPAANEVIFCDLLNLKFHDILNIYLNIYF
jgi:hypothetical protein